MSKQEKNVDQGLAGSGPVAKAMIVTKRNTSWTRLVAAILALTVMLAVGLAGCGSSNSDAGTGGSERVESGWVLDVTAAGQRLHEELAYRDRLEELVPEVVYTLLGIDGEDVIAQTNYFSSAATAEEIILLQAVDQAAAERLYTALEARIQDQKDIYAAYAPQEVVYLQSAVLLRRDEYVLYCVAQDGEAAKALAEEILAD